MARHIKVSLEESPYFKVTCQKSVGAKVAPGMEITYIIAFTPDEDKVSKGRKGEEVGETEVAIGWESEKV